MTASGGLLTFANLVVNTSEAPNFGPPQKTIEPPKSP
jgi:hypothetical protein